jgi:hypothetical protein
MLISFEFVCARARDLLIRGEPAAEVAQAVGFVDRRSALSIRVI